MNRQHRKDFILQLLRNTKSLWEEALHLEYWLRFQENDKTIYDNILDELSKDHLIERGGNKVSLMLIYNGERMNDG